jgi:hypothetical protein
MYPPPGHKYWGAEKHLAVQEGFGTNVVSHGDLRSLGPIKRIYSFTKLCTAMKHYDCALLRMDQAFSAMCRPYGPCSHPATVSYPTVEYILMSFSEPQSLLINMPTFLFCTRCGQCLGWSKRDQDSDLNSNVGYSDTLV